MGRDRPAAGDSGTGGEAIQREEIQQETKAVLDRWQSGVELFNVRRRLRGVLSAGLIVIAVQLLLHPGGLAGFLITLWFLLSLPIVAITACLLVLLKDPANASEMWWENGAVATVGLISLAGFTRAARVTPAGRTAWQFLFGSDHPAEEDYQFGTENSEIDLSAVARIRRYVWYAIVGSAGIILAEWAIRHDIFGAGVFGGLLDIDPGVAAWTGLFFVLVLCGLFVGIFAAAMDL